MVEAQKRNDGLINKKEWQILYRQYRIAYQNALQQDLPEPSFPLTQKVGQFTGHGLLRHRYLVLNVISGDFFTVEKWNAPILHNTDWFHFKDALQNRWVGHYVLISYRID